MKRLIALTVSAALAFAPMVTVSTPAAAQVATDQSASRTVVVPKDKSLAFHLDYAASEIVVAAPDTLQLVATTDRSFYVRGKAVGMTNILIYDSQHRLAQVVDVRVGYDVESLQDDLRLALPGERITAQNFAGGILLTGEVSTSGAALRAKAIAERYAPQQVQSALTMRQAQQVQVEVRVLEVSRSAMKDLGVNLSITNANGLNIQTGTGLVGNTPAQATIGFTSNIGTTDIAATIRALEQRGAIRTLAQPTLIAMSGEEASFLAGGEFPFPVPNGQNGVSIEFRTFGVKLNLTPAVQDSGQIRLKVAPEVSQLDPRNSLRIQGYEVPGLTTRRAATTVELRDGESFAIAGLFQQDYVNAVNQIPWAGSVPILGALFRSASWRRQETELVIIVTPHLTTPTNDISTLPNPLAPPDEPNAIDLILMGRSTSQPLAPVGEGVPPPPPVLPPADQPVPRPMTAPVAGAPPETPVAAGPTPTPAS
ncbi:MAG: type II and III secretion system protein family protein [Caulobacteraceae bacterium]